MSGSSIFNFNTGPKRYKCVSRRDKYILNLEILYLSNIISIRLNSNFKAWFYVLDTLVKEKKISTAVFKANMHHLDHAVFIIKQNSTPRGTSVRSMERSIGVLKKSFKARINVGESINNVLQRQGLLNFFKNTKMMSFEGVKKEVTAYKESSFIYHPSMTENDRSIMSQLWFPFAPEFNLSSIENDLGQLLVKDLVSAQKLIEALKGCKKRLFSLTNTPLSRIPIDFNQPIKVAGKAWQADIVYTSSFAKQRLSKKAIKRGGEHVMFESYYTKKV